MLTKKSKDKAATAKKEIAIKIKKKNNNTAEISINLPEDKETIQRKLTTLAHSGTKSALEKISEFIIKTEDKDLRGFAQCAYDEAEFFYYSPENEQEEKELMVAKMIRDREDYLLKLEMKAEDIRFSLKKLDIEREINKQILANPKNKEDMEAWKYLFSEDHLTCTQNELAEVEGDIKYESAWIKEAEKMIKTEKFKNLPGDFFDHMHFDGEGGTFWTDETGMDYDEPKIEHDPLCDCGDEEDADDEIVDVPF